MKIILMGLFFLDKRRFLKNFGAIGGNPIAPTRPLCYAMSGSNVEYGG
jgi:hypothetical protein